MGLFLQQIVDEHQTGAKSENMAPFCKRAYEESLKEYHGWVVQKVFSVSAQQYKCEMLL